MVCQSSWQWLAWWHLQPQTVGVPNPIISVVICNHQWWHQCCWSYDFFALGMYVQSSHLFYLGTFCLTLPNMAVTVSSVVIPIETLWRRKEIRDFHWTSQFKSFQKMQISMKKSVKGTCQALSQLIWRVRARRDRQRHKRGRRWDRRGSQPALLVFKLFFVKLSFKPV